MVDMFVYQALKPEFGQMNDN